MKIQLNVHYGHGDCVFWSKYSFCVFYFHNNIRVHKCIMHLKLHEVQLLDLALIHNRFSISVSDKNPWFVCFLSRKDYETFPYLYDFLQPPPPPSPYATPFTVWNHAFYIKNDTFDDKHVLYNRWRLVYVHVVFGHGSVSAPSCVRTSRKLEVVLNQRISIKMFWAVNT